MATYRLSNSADQDFDSLYVYGVLTFGLEQADAYAAGMQARFTQIAEKPRLYQAVDDIRPGYRRSVYGSHAIYYRIEDGGVLIVRILRGQDVSVALTHEDDA
ncbi:type II toxin-antitoxin system RelE/ParE family toxin [Algiphilus sp. W345]|uniref:Toxin n=1 Tax=Banduia mediterranea TaxID=3075609 RepID=A0ABU2WPK5_9GAMM|nr:type II toxin-antitoxin system RelE/ParE family toxin [Algiphilus sp. W345]MDT0499179.1 type II toxin-antitoxin system RelE/ParE family toxin [Algiphilus sp. W345]